MLSTELGNLTTTVFRFFLKKVQIQQIKTVPLPKTDLMIERTTETLQRSVAKISFHLQLNKTSHPTYWAKSRRWESIVFRVTLKYFNSSFKQWNAP